MGRAVGHGLSRAFLRVLRAPSQTLAAAAALGRLDPVLGAVGLVHDARSPRWPAALPPPHSGNEGGVPPTRAVRIATEHRHREADRSARVE